MRRPPIHLPLLGFLGLVLLPGFLMPHRTLAADMESSSLLLHPEQAFAASSPGTVNFAVGIDGHPLAYGDPQILVHTNGPRAEFVAGLWKDTRGAVTHRREVLIVKPDYGVIVDHLYPPGEGQRQEHEVTCTTSLVAESLTKKDASSLFLVSKEGNEGLFLGHLSPDAALTEATFAPETKDQPPLRELTQSCRIALPSPFATFFCGAGKSPRKVEFVKPANPMIVKCRVTSSDGRIEDVGIAWEPRDLHLGGKHFKGWAAVSRDPQAASSSAGDIEINPP